MVPLSIVAVMSLMVLIDFDLIVPVIRVVTVVAVVVAVDAVVSVDAVVVVVTVIVVPILTQVFFVIMIDPPVLGDVVEGGVVEQGHWQHVLAVVGLDVVVIRFRIDRVPIPVRIGKNKFNYR